MTTPPPASDETPPRWIPSNGRGQPVIYLRKLVLLEDLSPGAVKPIREVQFRAGLNIVWADPKSAEAASGGVRVAGHSAGKTTLCRILRWLLGETHFAPPKLQSRIASDLKDGWAVLTMEIDSQPWLVGRRFFDKADHCSVPGMTLEELYANGWPEGANAREFLAELKKATVGKLVRKRLPAREEEIPWTHILGWLARDQETSLVDVIAWRSSSKTPGTQGPTDAERHLIMRMILDMLSEPEGRELESYAKDKDKRADEKSAKVALQDRFDQSCRRLTTIVPGEGIPVAGELLLPPARKIVQDKLEQLTRLNQALEENTLILAEQTHRQALSALFTARRGVTAAEKDLKKAEHHYNECEKIRVSAEKEIKQAALKCPPGRCGATKEEADAVGGCKAFKETPPSFELESLLQKFTQMRDEALERYQQAKAELDEARLPIPDLERNERALSEHLETQKTEREKLVAEAAGLKSLSTSEKVILDDAETALNTLEACDTRIKDLRQNMSESRARQREMLKSHLPVRMRFSTCFEQVLCFLLGPETSGHIEFDDDGAIVPIAESREPMSSGAIDALTVVALDLAAMLWSVTGHGHHPRLVIHDSPKVADMAPALYAPIFDLAAQAEDDANGTPTFQYILTTTEPPPKKYLETERIVLTLDASQSEGRLFKRDFKA
jgi:hypothetical protein